MVTLYVDADDTILDSSKAVIEILNEKYNLYYGQNVMNDYLIFIFLILISILFLFLDLEI